MTELVSLPIILVVLLLLFLTGIELAYGMAIMGIVGFALLASMGGAGNMMAKELIGTFSSYGFTVVPVFVLMGQVAFNVGLAKDIYDAAHKMIGHVSGGLALATVVAATAFKTVCGSTTATVATFSSVAIPQMDRYGYDRKLSTGVTAVLGTLGILMPPSVVLIIFGLITEQPIGPLFLAALIPSLLLSALFACVIIGWCKMNPSLGPKSEKYPLKEVMASFKGALAPIVIFVIVIAGLMYGFFTPTEAGSVGAASVIVLGLLKRQLTWELFKKSVIESLRTSCMVLMLIAGSVILGRWLSITNTPQIMSDWIGQLAIHRSLVMILICMVYLVGGSFIDDLAFLILATPVFFPTILKLGYDPKWVAVVLCLTIMVGSVIPPVAMCVFIVKNITKVPMSIIYKGVYPFLISLVFCAVLVFLFPQIVLFLPAHFAAK